MELKRTNYIGQIFKREAKRQRYNYDEMAKALGVAGKQNVYHRLNRMPDENWTFLDVANLCDMLYIDMEELADSVRKCMYSD